MSWQASGWAARTKTGSKGLKATFFALAASASEHGVVFARQDTIAELAECDERTVRRDYARLRDKGLIRIFERHRADGKQAADVIVLMMPEQWCRRTKSPAACEDHFSGHLVTEKTTDEQEKVFTGQALVDASSECPPGSAAGGQNEPEDGAECPPVHICNSDGNALTEKENSENQGEKPADTCVRQESYTVDYTGRARATPGGDPDGPPGDAPDPPDQSAEAERVNRHWKPAREHFVKRRSEGEALAWWDDLIPLRHDDDGTLVLDAPSQFTLDQIQARYSRAMEWALREAVAQSPQDGANGQLRFVIEGLAAKAKASRKARAEEARSAATGTKRSEKQQSKPASRRRG